MLAIFAITCVFCHTIKMAKNHVFNMKIYILRSLLFLQLLMLKKQMCAQKFDFPFEKLIFFAHSYIFLKTFLYQKETCGARLIINIKLILLHIHVQYMCTHYWFHYIIPTPKSLKIRALTIGQGITPVEICRQTAAVASNPPLRWTRGELFFLTERS